MADPTLLRYAFATSPAPLAVTTGGTPASGAIDLGVFNGGKVVYCSQILVAVPIGDTATDLSADVPRSSLNTGRWTVSSGRRVAGPEIGLDGGDYAQFTFTARSTEDELIDFSLVLGLRATVNAEPGTFTYHVQELSGTDPNDLTLKSAVFPLDKRPPTFTLANLMASTVDAPTVPCTRFTNGVPVHVSWQSNGTWFQLFQAGNPTPIYAGPDTSYTLAGGLSDATTFVLAASVTGDPSGDQPSSGYQTLYLYETLALGVSNPDITPRTVAASGTVTAGGTVTGPTVVGTTSVSAPTVSATTELTGPALAVSGKATAASLAVSSVATLAATYVTNLLSVGGPTTLAGTRVGGDLSVDGALTTGDLIATGKFTTAQATVAVLGAPQVLSSAPATYTAPTDGVVVARLDPPPSAGGTLGSIGGKTTSGIVAQASAGYVQTPGGWSPMLGSFALPVRAGDRFSLAVNVPSGSMTPSFVWVPVGAGTPTLVGLDLDEDAVWDGALPAGEPAPEPIDELVDALRSARGDDAVRLREALNAVLGSVPADA
jgi:hypothetical protein